jgi:tetratricopeptide (TPR) repeat protein
MASDLAQVLQIHLDGDLALAEEVYRYLLQYPNPDALVLVNLAVICSDSGRAEEACALLKRVLLTDPDLPEAYYNLGNILQNEKKHKEAVNFYRQAIRLNETFFQAHYNLGNSLLSLGNIEEAVSHYEEALLYEPNHYNARINLAMAMLLLGQFERGWNEYEYRFLAQPNIISPSLNLKKWDEDFLFRGTLLLIYEQGLGDTIQFSRYLGNLKNKGMKVALCLQKPLKKLFEGLDPEILIYSAENYADLDLSNTHWFPLMSLPRLFKTDLLNIPSPTPLLVPLEHQRYWKAILGSRSKFRIALTWQGNPQQEKSNSRGRSFPLESLAVLAKSVDVEFISLQKLAGSEQLDNCSFRDKFIHSQQEISQSMDFLDTAAIMQLCDLVITSDTSVAHLAGTLNVKTWVALKKIPEWRWLLETGKTPWYSSVTLFRQSEDDNWDEVFMKMAFELKNTLNVSA